MSEALGDTTWLHSTTADIRIVISSVGTSHHTVVDVQSHPSVTVHTASRGLCRIVGPITVSVQGPGAQTKTTDCRAALIPNHYSIPLTTRSAVFARPLAVAAKSAIYLPNNPVVLRLPSAVDTQLKPDPVFDNHLKIALAWTVDGGAATDVVDVAIDFSVQLAGIGYV